MIIALDGMGGDHAPGEIIAGALKSLDEFKDISIHIYGDEQAILVCDFCTKAALL